jgi:hypothetical protein
MATWLESTGQTYIARAPDSAALSIVGDIDLRMVAKAVDWTPTVDGRFFAKRTSLDASQHEWHFTNLSGATRRLDFGWRNAAATLLSHQMTGVHSGVDGEWLSVRVTLDVDDGAGNRVCTFYEKAAAGPDADIDTSTGWTQLQQFTVAGTTDIRGTVATFVEIGSENNGVGGRFVGGVGRGQIRDGINGTVVASPDFTALTAGATSYTDTQGNVWTFGTSGITIGEEAQIARPAVDVSVGSWLTHTGASTNLFATIDEASPDDSDYIRSPTDPVNAPVVVKLGPLTDPAISTGHIFRYRYGKSGSATIDIVAQLRQGYTNEGSPGTLIASATHTNVSATLTTAALTLTGGEADAITNYGDLYLRFVANKTA